jgi:hypothetical protein
VAGRVDDVLVLEVQVPRDLSLDLTRVTLAKATNAALP